MKTAHATVAAVLALLAGCGSSPKAQGLNPYIGRITVNGPLPAGTTTCQGTLHVVRFVAGKVDVQALTVAGGECVQFRNDDTSLHRPASSPSNPCAALAGSGDLSPGQTFPTLPLGSTAATQLCDWEDARNPPGTGGGGGGY